jgi:hypothetical protein
MGIYDFAGIENTLSLLTKPALPTSIGASYTIIEGESDITARVMLKGKGKRADGGVQTKMNDGTDKVTFEDIDGLEWIAAADGEVRNFPTTTFRLPDYCSVWSTVGKYGPHSVGPLSNPSHKWPERLTLSYYRLRTTS